MLHTSKRGYHKSFLLGSTSLKGSPAGSGSLLSSRICVAGLESVSASSSTLVGRALYVSPFGGLDCSAFAGMASFKPKTSMSVSQNWHLCTNLVATCFNVTVRRLKLVYQGHTRQQKGNSGQELITIQNVHQFSHCTVGGAPVSQQLLCGTFPLRSQTCKSPAHAVTT